MSQSNTTESPTFGKRNVLGRGLSALIPQKNASTPPTDAVASTSTHELNVDDILPGDAQPRQRFDGARLAELADSIRQNGVLQPILVRRRGAQQYEIVAGERRWRAAQQAGLKTIPVVVTDAAPEKILTLALVENLQREDLNPIEEAEAFQRLHVVLGYTQAEIAAAVGKERATVANSLRLLKLPTVVRQSVLDNELSMGHARALLALEDPLEIERLAGEIKAKGWSVRDTERAAEGPRARRKKSNARETDAERDVRQRLQRALGTKVELTHKGGRGKIAIHFGSAAELERLMTKFGA